VAYNAYLIGVLLLDSRVMNTVYKTKPFL